MSRFTVVVIVVIVIVHELVLLSDVVTRVRMLQLSMDFVLSNAKHHWPSSQLAGRC